ncbi:hypothetical protein HJC23_012165 [Cyclotella cryptica]|uniref:Uncharacterized protein n=1 Tax=Cyclotella cryptica TaxID=29204 RepID=A0ABD3PDS0_9STRA
MLSRRRRRPLDTPAAAGLRCHHHRFRRSRPFAAIAVSLYGQSHHLAVARHHLRPVSAVAAVAAVDAPPVAVAFVDVGASVAATNPSASPPPNPSASSPLNHLLPPSLSSACSQQSSIATAAVVAVKSTLPDDALVTVVSRNLSMQSPPPPLNSLTAAHKSHDFENNVLSKYRVS